MDEYLHPTLSSKYSWRLIGDFLTKGFSSCQPVRARECMSGARVDKFRFKLPVTLSLRDPASNHAM